MKRFSVLYLLKGQYQHVGMETHQEAKTLLNKLVADPKRKPVGIYDAKTELFEWEPNGQQNYNQAEIGEQGKQADQVIQIAQALRRRDSSWLLTGGFQRPSLFA